MKTPLSTKLTNPYIHGHVFFGLYGIVHFWWASSFALALLSLVWTFNTKVVYHQKSKYSSKFGSVLQWRLVPILSLLKVWSNKWAKKSFSVKEQKSQSYLFQTEQNFTAHKTLVWSTYVWNTAIATIFFKKE